MPTQTPSGRWKARVNHLGKIVCRGTFNTESDALTAEEKYRRENGLESAATKREKRARENK